MIICPTCNRMFEDDDMVILDIINTLTHKDCFHGSASNIKDFSSYKNIKNCYKFLLIK